MGGLIKIAIERPVAVLALILLTVLFGVVALRLRLCLRALS